MRPTPRAGATAAPRIDNAVRSCHTRGRPVCQGAPRAGPARWCASPAGDNPLRPGAAEHQHAGSARGVPHLAGAPWLAPLHGSQLQRPLEASTDTLTTMLHHHPSRAVAVASLAVSVSLDIRGRRPACATPMTCGGVRIAYARASSLRARGHPITRRFRRHPCPPPEAPPVPGDTRWRSSSRIDAATVTPQKGWHWG